MPAVVAAPGERIGAAGVAEVFMRGKVIAVEAGPHERWTMRAWAERQGRTIMVYIYFYAFPAPAFTIGGLWLLQPQP